jgi:hypothetical protein
MIFRGWAASAFVTALSEVPPATAPAGGSLERVFNVLKADPVIGFLAICIVTIAFLASTLLVMVRRQLARAEKQNDVLNAALLSAGKEKEAAVSAEKDKRIELAMTVVTLQTKTGVVLDEAMATLSSIDDILPPVLNTLEKLGLRRRPGSSGSFTPVPPVPPTTPKTGT